MAGHIKSIVPQRGGVSPIDNDTVFLAPLNEHASDVIKGVNPIGNRHSLLFDGASTYIEVPVIDSLASGHITVMVWINPSTWTSHTALISKRPTTSNGFILFMLSGTNLTMDYGGAANRWSTGYVPPLNTWTHIAYTHDGTNGRLYVNGILHSSTNIGNMSNTITTCPLRIGADTTSVQYLYSGKMEEVRLFDSALSESEIKMCMTNSFISSTPTGHWKLSENQGSISYDSSPSGNDGLITGSLWTEGRAIYSFGDGGVLIEEGTVNLVTGGPKNSHPSIGNNWGTYDTAQYNSNTSYSIGSIESVANNIVTLSTVGRPIYTYDVLNPDTTGGGVTAGTDYFIKKHSDNSFSLHQYDSSQDGSKGFRVHDSVNNDTRIAINATDFPTMWHGSPHRPNGGLVKEVMINGFSHKGKTHDCLRMYTNFRTDNNFYGYLAYGVTPPVTAGLEYTISFYHRAVTPETVGRVISPSFYTAGTSPYWTGAPSLQLASEWQRYEYTGIATNTGGTNFYLNAGFGVVWEIAEIQVEAKSYMTSFTDGVRSNARLQYPASIINPTQYTVSCWAYLNWANPSGAHQTILEVDEAPGGSTYRFLMFIENNEIGVLNASDTTQSVAYGLTGVEAKKWYHLVASFDGTRLKYYVDGELKSDIASVTPVFKENAMFGIGGPNWNLLNGYVDEVRIDRIARTSEEIRAWYYQGRNGW